MRTPLLRRTTDTFKAEYIAPSPPPRSPGCTLLLLTSFSFYLTWYFDPLADACHVFKCKYNGLCLALATGTPPLCKCPEEFPVNFNPVCGTDGQTYSNIGEMKYKACREQKIVEVRHEGKCGKECLHLAVVYHVKNAPCLPPSFLPSLPPLPSFTPSLPPSLPTSFPPSLHF